MRSLREGRVVLWKVASITIFCVALMPGAMAWADDVTFTADTTIDPNDITYEDDNITVDGCILTVDGVHAFNSLAVINGGIVTHSANADEQVYTLNLTIAADVTVDADSAIDVRGRGYASVQGPGAGVSQGSYGSGAGYGGNGGRSLYMPTAGGGYGDVLAPMDIGSGGGNGSGGYGGFGGGAIRLDVSGVLTVDGNLMADGNNAGPNAGGGSGGSVYLTVNTLAGTGVISAKGGLSGQVNNAGAGGGGRIAIEYVSDSFVGSISAIGGANGWEKGGAGTIFTKQSAATGELLIDNGGNSGAWTQLTSPTAFDVIIADGAIVNPTEALTIGDLLITTGAILTHVQGGAGINLTIQGDATIDPNSAMDVNGQGYGSVTGPGAGVSESSYGSGAGYGGNGGRAYYMPTAGGGYGDIIAPTDFGSGGGNGSGGYGGFGGGAIRLDVSGVLTVDGNLTADGNNAGPNAGGGSGGSVYLTVNTLAGTGVISANGGFSGQAANAGAGGGGRIAVEYVSDSFAGSMSAIGGGNGWEKGGAGTIFTKQNVATGELLIDNGGNSGAWTPLTSPEAFDVTIAASAIMYPTEALTIGDLLITTGAILTHVQGGAGINLTIQGDATIDPNSAMDVNGQGYGSVTGPGAGVSESSYGSGAGYGGNGGRSLYMPTAGGGYGDVIAPTDFGSGGGNGSGGYGGFGGGAIRLDVSGVLTVDGNLTADGNNAGPNAGGGSGGSIYLTVDTLAGTGVISADGGLSGQVTNAGSGSGGRIAIEYVSNSFAGGVSVVGGANGWEKGGAGTIYTKNAAASTGNVLVDNGGSFGAWTPLTSPEEFALTLADGAIAYPTAALTLSNLHIAADGLLTHPNTAVGFDVTVQGNAAIDVDGALSVDGRGYAADTGPGAGTTSSGYGSGAGYGGAGGNGYANYCAGGSAYEMDSATAPTEFGSGGASGYSSIGGAGGGAVRLIVNGALTVDGRISSAGADGYNSNGGGGAGGSLYMTVGTLAGGGAISADGGAGGGGNAGGGGGGRIAIYYDANAFTGTISSFGGGGWMRGGAGTIYTQDTSRATGELLVDNGGAAGAWTPITTPTVFDLTIGNSAIVYPAAVLTVSNLHIAANGLLTHPNEAAGFEVTVQNDAMIDVDGALAVDGRGYAAGTGPGAGTVGSGYGSGAAYGGNGGNGYSNYCAGGSAYELDLVAAPTEFGSGGASGHSSSGGAGGGGVRLIVNGVLTVDGRISSDGADGYNSNGGGGAGGSLYMTVGTLVGSGLISAEGGVGDTYAGGGGGGRIAVVCDDNTFGGMIAAFGGAGWMQGGAGSVYVKIDAGPAEVTYNNNDVGGAWTPITTPEVCDMVVGAGAIVYPNETLTVHDLHVTDGGTITHTSGYADFYLRVEGDATVENNGAIQAGALGYGAGAGPGAGQVSSGYGSGGGYGGQGGNGYNNYVAGGLPYGFAEWPNDRGSGGASGSSSAGGAGGGFMRMTVDGALLVDGAVSVNGGDGWSSNGGGGSGGGLIVKVGTLDGAGVVSANGGLGGSQAGGGGGGRIAIFSCNVLMTLEQITATGGTGWDVGDDGTIFLGSGTVEITAQPVEQVVALDGTATFSVAATGDGTLSYQWRRNGVDLVDDGRISGATTPNLTIDLIEFCDIGSYDVVVTDDCGGFPSNSVPLYVWNSGDLDGDADVDLADLAQLLSGYGITSGATWDQGDLSGDGDVDLSDLAALLGVYGTVCE